MSFNLAYRDQLEQTYPLEIVEQITEGVKFADIASQEGQTVPYVEVGGDESDRPLVFIPGFGEGIVNKSSFAAELAMRGARVILPGQNRKSILRDADNQRSAVRTQANNYLSVIEQVAGSQTVDIMAHSYGSIVFDEMVRLSPDRFKDSNVVMLAPAGLIENETFRSLGRRWLAMMKSESSKKRPMEFPDHKNVTGQASAKTLLANVPRMIGELRDLRDRKVDYQNLVSRVGSVSVLSYAEDRMFPEEELEPTLARAVEAGVVWATPVSVDRVESGEMSYSGDGATHDDEQFNPSRVAAALLQIVNQ